MHPLPKKDCQNPPPSLRFTGPGPIIRKAKTTLGKLRWIIENQTFPADSSHTHRYKQKDIKIALKQHYHDKCAYCEQYVERWDVEHYRPKKIYYWLAYSWDNLLFSCPTCNQDKKGEQFDVIRQRAQYSETTLHQIHCLTEEYNELEHPKLLHPEFDEVENVFTYTLVGDITSSVPRGKYTIQVCGLDRKKLSDRRKEVAVDAFQRKLQEDFLLYGTDRQSQLNVIKNFIAHYQSECKEENNQFLGFRHFIQKHLLTEIIQSAVHPPDEIPPPRIPHESS